MSLDLTSDFLQFTIAMPKSSKNGDYTFGRFTLDPEKLMLYRDGIEIALPVKVVKTLSVLIENRGTILSKDELIEHVWPDAIVEESNLSQNLYILRKTLGSKPDGGAYIETLRRRGYRFNAEVETMQRSQPFRPAPVNPKTNVNKTEVERHGNVLRFVDRHEISSPATDELPAPVVPPLAAHSPTPRIALFVAGLSVAAFVLVAFVLFGGSSSNAVEKTAVEMSVVKLTDGRRPFGATIAPDGGYFTYTEVDGDVSRVFVQQVGQSNRLEILSSVENVYQGLTFANDGRFVYVSTTDKKADRTWLLRVPSIGGPAIRVLDRINGPISLSPDGKEMVFTRVGKNSADWSVIIANSEGKSERVLLSRNSPANLGFAPSWSPDGKLIAVAEYVPREPNSKSTNRLLLVDAASAKAREFSTEDWSTLYRLAWTSDGNGIVMIGTRRNETYSTRRDNVYFVSYPDGRSTRITTDGNRYDPVSLGVTKDGWIVAVPSNRASQIWGMSANGDEKTAYQITRGSADGRAGLNALSDGGIAYVARSGDELNIWISRSEASEPRQLASGLTVVEETRADPAGKYLVFSSVIEGKSRLFKLDIDGSKLTQLTFGEDEEVDSDISPDGNRIVYATAKEIAGAFHHRLWSIPSQGGEPRQLLDFECSRPLIAPDGEKLSCVTSSEEVVILTADGHEIERSKLPLNVTSNYGIGWLPDSSGLAMIRLENGHSNIWSHPLGGGKSKKLTNFTSGIIYRYAFSPDGTRLFLARGYPTQDVVMITTPGRY